MSDDLDLAMLDASEWSEAPSPVPTPDAEKPWIDIPQHYLGASYVYTGARSDDRASWLRARRTGIGASEIAAILGESRWADAGTIYARKVAPTDDAEAREWQEWGLRLEPVILAAYRSERYADRPASPDGRLLRSREHPWALCTLDAWTWIGQGPDDCVPLELKTDRWGREWDDGPPREYMIQLQHQMLVTGARRASIAVLVGGSQLAWCDAARDERTISLIIREGRRFWQAVESREMPETRDHAALASAFTEERGRVVELEGAEWVTRDMKRCEARMVAQVASREADDIDAEIKRAMGRAEIARLDDGTEYSWRARRDGTRVLRRKETVR